MTISGSPPIHQSTRTPQPRKNSKLARLKHRSHNTHVYAAILLLSVAIGCRPTTDPTTPQKLHKPHQAPSFEFQAVGPDFDFRPTITNVQVADLDGDGRQEVLACDVQQNSVFLYSLGDSGWVEKELATDLVAPAHATVVDIDTDGDNDLIVSVMGNLHPDDGVIGRVVLLENNGGSFEKRTILDDVRRVVDVQPSDFDGDGDLDLAVAVFGYLRGQVLWLENLGNGTFQDHELLVAPGAIHVPVADYDNDGDPDIATVISQEEEEVWIFENQGNGDFAKHRVFFTTNFDLGSAGLVQADLDQDGDADLLLPVGDNLEDKYSHPQPYHGCIWLENQGGLKFDRRRLAHFPGTYGAAVGDLDQDSDQDVVLVSMVNDWDAPQSASLVWLENDGSQSFTQHVVARQPIQLTTVDIGDLNHDGRVDIVAGGLHVFRPFDRMGRISSWLQTESTDRESITTSELLTVDQNGPVPVPNLDVIDSITANFVREVLDKVTDKVRHETVTSADWNSLGMALFAYGFFEDAFTCFQHAVNLDDSNFENLFLIANCESRMGRLNDAVHHFQQARDSIDNETDQQRCEFEIGKTYLRLEEPTLAESALRRAGDHPHALHELAKLLMRSDRSTESLSVLDQLEAQYPYAIEYRLLKARVHEMRGEQEEASRQRDHAEYNARRLPVDKFTAGIERFRNGQGLRSEVQNAQQLLKSNQVEPAIRILEQTASVGWDQQTILLAAMAELKRANPPAAINGLEKLLEDRGDFPQGMLLLGDAYLANEETSKAREIWESTAAIRSGIALHERLGKLYRNAGDLEKSTEQNALRLQAIGIAELRNSNLERATVELQQALNENNSLVSSWFYLGECYRLRGQAQQAATAYRRCLQIAPQHGRANDRLMTLNEP